MKNKFAFILAALCLAACNLDEKPYGFYSEGSFYKTEADAQAATMYIYDAINYIEYSRAIVFLGGMNTDELDPKGDATQSTKDLDSWSQNNFRSNVTLGNFFKFSYITINRANAVIENVPAMKIDEALSINGKHVSVDAPFADGEDNSLLDVLVNDNSPSADKQLVLESLRQEIQKALSCLNERERMIIEAYYGIEQPEMTLEEIGTRYGLTRERVRQIKEKAIRRLRNNTQNKMLKSYLG